MKSRTEVRSMENEHSILVRRAVIFGVPFLYYVRRPGALNNVDLIADAHTPCTTPISSF
jgi:hypothetical protein